MPTEILMPALSPTMEEGTLAKWLVSEGDSVQSGDIIAEIETDKATMEFEAVDEGTIGKILILEGTADVKVNTPIAILLEDGESADDITASAGATAPQAEAPAAAEAAPARGSDKAAPPAPVKDGGRIFASPLARRIAEQKGLDLGQITGSGPRGRIVKADVEGASAPAAAPAPAAPQAAPATQAQATAPAPAVQPGAIAKLYANREYREIPLDGMRKTIAARLTEAKQTIPHFYLRRSVQLDALMAFRAQLNKQLEGRGVKLSVNDFIIKACANALQQVPAANAVWAGDRILQLTPSDVAVAVAIEGGLFTPVLKDAHHKSLSALSAEMKDLATRARDRKLSPEEYQGGSFAISNLGMFGIENFDAVINPPHGAILAVGAGVKKPVVDADGNLGVATVMSMTLSVDHRVIDGALGAELLGAIVDNLKNPLAMLA
ncbi:pyruvate dehydrogenase complex dihydrolipoamide acetyltransferase [Tropicibacter naphthalenivorans]|uniref:Acetyltransferase component of pyruvate dehydrogenase complex n=1 Tax=Tropicibacter naphthalenivorans TaxID=441103 RepID=A0A0P1GFD0_9RHOB|nr:pyruvate dehydrogenase complex dihydrolipoamide acetyltransferase [Tropicibacter naphthalenivorans]CUH80207.1 Dihydrolipoyllysine-residue acetyltransferase component of pyruvate dehydrogenase complex [Tropicibacter naphthalenivorans]SMC85522.1 pyruvate dehydrogenase E2 component (dihydrolipoamide acetyltransferase) [Tropicibacter naphthalenivorans]